MKCFDGRAVPLLAAATVLATAWGCGGGEEGPARERAAAEARSAGDMTAPVAPIAESGMQGTMRVSRGAEMTTVKLEMLGLETDASYPAVLREGGCDEEGAEVVTLEPFTTAAVGLGTSVTEVPAGTLEAGGTYSVHVRLSDGTAAACGEIAPGA